MAAAAVLIAAFSARALAASARRAGFLPLVVDCFGDLDTDDAAHAARCLPARVQIGFTPRPLLAALDELAAAAPSPPVGLVLGSGFECNPRLVARLASRYRLIGCSPDTIRSAKDPDAFFGALHRLGIVHPETHLAPPTDNRGWLMKRIGGSGGLHIVPCPSEPRPDARRYFQRRVAGEPISLMGLFSPRETAFAISRQWSDPLPRRPFRYGGAAGGLTLDADLEARMIGIALSLARELRLVGLVSFDFLVDDKGEARLLEVNPRPGATLDIFDDDKGTLFAAHVEAGLGAAGASSSLAATWSPPKARASAILYADRGPLSAPNLEWPAWSADRPRPGSEIGKHQPLATVVADGVDLAAAESACRERLGVLADLLYEDRNGKGASA